MISKLSLPLIALLLITGCASGGGEARVTFSQSDIPDRNSLYQQFPKAYISSARDGEYDVVLVSDVIGNAGEAASNKAPLKPVTAPPVQQAMHIHIFWRPVAGAMVKESSITNAIFHWYVFGDANGTRVNSVHYEGAGFVNLSPGRIASITIGDAKIEPKNVNGNMKDPIGSSRISGAITAVRNDSRVRELLKTLADQSLNNERFWTGRAAAN